MSTQKLKTVTENPMRAIVLEKVTLSCGGSGNDLEKAKKLLEILSGKQVQIIRAGSKRRIPDFGVKPNMELGVRVTLRRKDAQEILKRLLGAVENTIRKKSISENTFSFGIQEYIEIPGIEYQREIGIRGLNVTVSFMRRGFRISRKKVKQGRLPPKQVISTEEIIKFMGENFKTRAR